MRANTLGGVEVPVMYQGGTRDWITVFIKERRGAYAESAAPKYFVEFKHVGHRGWTDAYSRRHHEEMVSYSEAFLDRYLKGKPIPSGLLKRHRGIAALRIEE